MGVSIPTFITILYLRDNACVPLGGGPTNARSRDLPSSDRTWPKLGGGDGGGTWSRLLRDRSPNSCVATRPSSTMIQVSGSLATEPPDLPVARIGYFFATLAWRHLVATGWMVTLTSENRGATRCGVADAYRLSSVDVDAAKETLSSIHGVSSRRHTMACAAARFVDPHVHARVTCAAPRLVRQ
jgi:hypothetical protein